MRGDFAKHSRIWCNRCFPIWHRSLRAAAPELRGRLLPNVQLSELTWLRAGGRAQLLFTPADEDDLAYFMARCPADMPVMVMGVGSNLLVRDGGVPGVVIRLARGFNEVTPLGGTRIRAGAAVPDLRLAQAAAAAGNRRSRLLPGHSRHALAARCA